MKATVTVVLVGAAILMACVPSPYAPAQPEDRKVVGDTVDLQGRVATLETQVAALRQQIQDDKLVNKLSGRWMENSWIRSGKRIDESAEVFGGGGGGDGGPVEWLLATDTRSQRWVLSPEPVSTSFGEFRVDTSKIPALIEFQMERNGKVYPVRGIVRYTYMRAEIAIPTELFDGDKFLDPPRPKTFESTEENGYSVYSLIRESFKKTGVW